jgi:ubiquinone/menaquinone biosynthesis C-methylase UbiE
VAAYECQLTQALAGELPLECGHMDALLERTFEAEQRHFWFRGFKRFVVPLLEEAMDGRVNLRLLDAGCGTGANLPLLQRYGTPFGLELFSRGLRFAQQRGQQRLVQGSVTHLPLTGSCIDIVLSFDVLYCLETTAEQMSLQEMYRVLRPGGYVIINVAALDMLKGDHSVLGGEVRRYTKRELHEKIERTGFHVRRLTYTNAVLFPITAAVRMFQRMRGVKTGESNKGDFYVPPAPINALFSGALALEATLIRAGIDMPVGSSLLCFAKKPES